MPATVVIGGQWGDEGKGRIVDLLAQRATVIARYSAGSSSSSARRRLMETSGVVSVSP